jgi:hypothetical protein
MLKATNFFLILLLFYWCYRRELTEGNLLKGVCVVENQPTALRLEEENQ